MTEPQQAAKDSIKLASQRCASSDAEEIAKEEMYGKPEAPLSLQMLPFHKCKVVYFVRHGQGFHNVAGHADPANYLSWDYEDAHLTDFGWQQAAALKHHNQGQPDVKPEVVIVSPMTRAIETAVGAFGGGKWQNGDHSQPLMIEQSAQNERVAAHDAVSSSGCPPFVSWEGCREHLGLHPCDRRRTKALYHKRYPGIDFSLVADGEDSLWTPDARETGPSVKGRGLEFVKWLNQRPESRIAVVSHSSFLFFLFSNFGRDCSDPVKRELQTWYQNCEMRTVILSSSEGEGGHDPYWFEGGKNIVAQTSVSTS